MYNLINYLFYGQKNTIILKKRNVIDFIKIKNKSYYRHVKINKYRQKKPD